MTEKNTMQGGRVGDDPESLGPREGVPVGTQGVPGSMKKFEMRPPVLFAVRIMSEKDIPVGAPVVGMRVPWYAKVSGWAVIKPHWTLLAEFGPVKAEFGDYLVTDGEGDWFAVKADVFEARFREVALND